MKKALKRIIGSFVLSFVSLAMGISAFSFVNSAQASEHVAFAENGLYVEDISTREGESFESDHFRVTFDGYSDWGGMWIEWGDDATVKSKDTNKIAKVVVNVGDIDYFDEDDEGGGEEGCLNSFHCSKGKWTRSGRQYTITDLVADEVSFGANNGSLQVENVKVYAAGEIYSVTFNLDEGTINKGNITEYTEYYGATLPTDVTKEGYAFLGWYDNEGCTGSPVTSIPAHSSGAKEFWAKWKLKTYFSELIETHSYQHQYESEHFYVKDITSTGYSGGFAIYNGASANIESKDGSIIGKIILNVGSEEGNIPYFVCSRGSWTRSGKSIIITGICSSKVNIYTTTGNYLYIRSVEVYSSGTLSNLTLHLDGGKIESGEYDKYSELGPITLPTDVVKYKHLFLGWYDNENLEGNPVTEIPEFSVGDKEFWAKYEEVSYYTETINIRTKQEKYESDYFLISGVTSNFDEGIGIISDSHFADIETKDGSMLGKLVLKVGYYYSNINSFRCSEGKWTISGDTITVTHITSNKVTIYTAGQWLVIGQFQLFSSGTLSDATFHTNGGTINAGAFSQYGELGGATLPTDVTKYKAEFLGWYENEACTGTAVTEIPELTIGNKEYWAKWQELTYNKENINTNTAQTSYATEHFSITGNFSVGGKEGLQIVSSKHVDVESLDEDYIGKIVVTIGNLYDNWIGDIRCSEGKISINDHTVTIIGILNKKVTIGSANMWISIKRIQVFTSGIISDITYHENGGTINSGAVNKYCEVGGATLPTDVTRTDYEFLGWYDNEGFTGNPVTEIVPFTTGNKEYWAKWKEPGEILNDAIASLPNPVTKENEATVNEYKARYDAFDGTQKAFVSELNVKKLNDALQELADIDAAAAATVTINALPDNVTIENKAVVMAAKAEYDALTDNAKAKIPSESLNKLNAAVKEIVDVEEAEAAHNLINALPATVTLDNKDAVMAAKEAYDALSPEALAKLPEGDASKLNAALQEINDFESAAVTAQLIEALPAFDELTFDDVDEVKAAKASYDALNENAKTKVPSADVAKLNAEYPEALDFEAAHDVSALIEALPATVTLENKETVANALSAYQALSANAKAKVSLEITAKLNAAVKEINDIETAADVTDLIEALPATVTLENKEAVMEALEAYQALSVEGKAKVSLENTAKLNAAVKEIRDIEGAAAVAALIEALPDADDIQYEDVEDIITAKNAYEALSAEAKAKVPAEDVAKLEEILEAAKVIIDDIEAEQTGEIIEDLPAPEEITEDDRQDVEDARSAYESLSPEAKEKVAVEDLEKLLELEKALGDILDSGRFIDDVESMPALENLDLSNKDKIEALIKTYERLSLEAKAKVPAEDVAKLYNAREVIELLEIAKAEQEVADIIARMEALPALENITAEDYKVTRKISEDFDALSYKQQTKIPEALYQAFKQADNKAKSLALEAAKDTTVWYTGYSFDWIGGYFKRTTTSTDYLSSSCRLKEIINIDTNIYRFVFEYSNGYGGYYEWHYESNTEPGQTPTGLFIASGAGTYEDPFYFGILYDVAPVVVPTSINISYNEDILFVKNRVIALDATFDPVYTSNQEVKWTLNNDTVGLFTDPGCTTPVTEETTQTRVYAKGLGVGEAIITVTSRENSALSHSIVANVLESDPHIGLKWFIGSRHNMGREYYFRWLQTMYAKTDLSTAVMYDIHETYPGRWTCFFKYDGGAIIDFQLIAQPDKIPTGMTIVNGEGSYDSPYDLALIYDEDTPYIIAEDIELKVTTPQSDLYLGQVARLEASFDPFYTMGKKVIWKASNENVKLYADFECTIPVEGVTDVLTVYVKAEDAGYVVVTVTSIDNGNANAYCQFDVKDTEGTIAFDYTLWTATHISWSDAKLLVKEVETGYIAATLTLTGDDDYEGYLGDEHDNDWGRKDKLYLDNNKEYELIWMQSPYDGAMEDKYQGFVIYNPITIDTIYEVDGCDIFGDKQTITTFLSTDVPVVRIELSSDSLTIIKDTYDDVTATVKPGAIEDKTLTWSLNKDGIVALYSDEECLTPLTAVIDSNQTVYVKGLSTGVVTIAFTSVSDPTKTVYCPVRILDGNVFIMIKYELRDSYSDGWNGASLLLKSKATGEVVATFTVPKDKGISEGTLLVPNDEYELVWSKGNYDDECSFVLKNADDSVLYECDNASTLEGGKISEFGEPMDNALVAGVAEELIDSLLKIEDTHLREKDEIVLVREFYESLTDEQKALIPQEKIKKLIASETEIVDIEVAIETDEEINELPVVTEITLDDKDDILAAKEAYEALNDHQKEKIPAETLEKLEAAVQEIVDIEVAIETDEEINELPDVKDIALDDLDDILAVKEAYDALTDHQKEKIPEETRQALEDAVKEVETISEANDEIVELPDVKDIALTDEEAIKEAREAYDALTPEQKAKIPAEVVELLEKAEAEINTIVEANDEIVELPDVKDVALDDEEAVKEVKETYEALSEEQKAKLPEEVVKKLEDVVKEVETIVEANDEIKELPVVAEVSIKDKEEIETAKATYDALSEQQKAKLPEEVVNKLEDVVKELVDVETAFVVEEEIEEIPEVKDITLENKEDIKAVRDAYEALTDHQKEKIPAETVKTLERAEKEIVDIETSNEVDEKIDALPSFDDISFGNDKDVEKAREAYNALSKEAKEKIPSEDLDKLQKAEQVVEELKTIVVTEGETKGFNKEVSEEKATSGIDVHVLFNVASKEQQASKEVAIKSGETTVTFDAAAVNQIGNNATKFSVKVTYEELQGPAAKVDLSLEGTTFDQGKVKVNFKFDKAIPAGMRPVVRYLNDNGEKITMVSTYKDGVISFETNHFSSYVVEYELTGGAIAGVIIASVVGSLLVAGLLVFALDLKGAFCFSKKNSKKKLAK